MLRHHGNQEALRTVLLNLHFTVHQGLQYQELFS